MSAPWWEGPLVGFDLETTGPDPETARIVTACVVVHAPGQDPYSRTWLVDPGMEIPAGATAVHGVTTEQARAEGIPAGHAFAEIATELAAANDRGIPLVAFNACFDFTVLDREARRHGYAPLAPTRVVDPFVLDKQVDRYRRGGRKLTDVAAHYGIRLDNAHAADADALAAVEVARAIAARVPGAPEDARHLHEAQIAWRAEQCASLEDYFRRTKDPSTVIAREWPVLPFTGEAAA